MKEIENPTEEHIEKLNQSSLYMIDITDFDTSIESLTFLPVLRNESDDSYTIGTPGRKISTGKVDIVGFMSFKDREQDERKFLGWLKNNVGNFPDLKPAMDLLRKKYDRSEQPADYVYDLIKE